MGGGQRPLLAGSMMMDGVVALYRGRLRPWMYTWGARVDEVTAQLPGDGLVEAHTPRTTRAVTIDAPIADVWPWLAQIRKDCGGFYSYSLLERAVGVHVHNANSIHPEWQDLRVGDTGVAGAVLWRGCSAGRGGGRAVIALGPDVAR